ncbi:MAG: recombinase family protein [Planctomycetes bacterium]|nr:recombinase family protein [Planctomycetota bacterium]MCH9724970.1 recombinase family protein [Planctomycetota bacterium]MCH9777569.1 recombinase family protein [Planctomycetota bacterium]MCH9793465.1 recombinase family protein [Planctomycetota bacterium]
MKIRKKVSARKSIEKKVSPGDASKYISYDCIKPGDQVVLYCRVSTRQQNYTGNLDAQERYLRTQVTERGAIVVTAVQCVGSGFYPFRLAYAASLAKQSGAKIVALTTDRFIRNEFFKSTGSKFERNARANIEGLETLKQCAEGIELVTLVHPNTSLLECSGWQKKIGQQVKSRKGGRPKKNPPGYKKERRHEKLPKVRELRSEGVGIRETARRVSLPEATVWYWVRNFLN